MSMQYCHNCDDYIDTDHDVEHFEEHEDMTNTKPTGGDRKKLLSYFQQFYSTEFSSMGAVEMRMEKYVTEILDWHNDLILQEKRELLERIEAMTGILKIELAPLKHEFDVNYEIYHSTDGGVIKRNQSREVLLEYENGSKGKRMFSLNERIRVLEDLSTDLKKELEEE